MGDIVVDNKHVMSQACFRPSDSPQCFTALVLSQAPVDLILHVAFCISFVNLPTQLLLSPILSSFSHVLVCTQCYKS